ncbi:alpha-galactosidase [Agromyces archimandritae]|uniref:alpha-galactosidase n=1 Tax=Agromyces archimandritae TaxID=2781962 RepID=UPI001FD437C2|nr:alpha-galactosidase [Agromyces archimandritae]
MILEARVVRAALQAGGRALVLDWSDGGVPVVVHWGAAIGEPATADLRAAAAFGRHGVDAHHAPAIPAAQRLLPLESSGWKGRPALAGRRADGSGWSPVLRHTGVEAHAADIRIDDDAVHLGAGTIAFDLLDEEAGLAVALVVEMLPTGLVRTRLDVENRFRTPYLLDEAAIAMPVPLEADELLDFAGRWTKERTPFRAAVTPGIHLHDGRHGRTGFDAPPMLCCGRRGFDFAPGSGRVHGVHVGFSGNHRSWIERGADGLQLVAGGELLLPGEIRLAGGERYASPWIYFGTGDGLDDLAHSVHDWLRARPDHPGTARPVTLNVWEAVYFDHDLDRLLDLAERAADIGVERFVLDDGWFSGRRDDTSGLGDWHVDGDVWPGGLHPLVDRVRELGMQFGLWVEPEMLSADSDLARGHPDWMLSARTEPPVEWRSQQVLDLAEPAAYEHVRDRLAALLDEYDISYLKWDHNRDLIAAGHPADAGSPAVHRQTLAAYRLMDELRAASPGLEIESCASGGGRIDLGMVEHAQRFWPSDCIDPLERLDIMRWTAQLLPLELLGSHIGSTRARTTGRTASLDFRAVGAYFGHYGIEWDLTAAGPEELDRLAEWVRRFRADRELLFTGRLHRRDLADGSARLLGVVAPDGRRARYQLAVVTRSPLAPLGRAALPGLDADRRYRVRAVGEAAGLVAPEWMPEGLATTGRLLGTAGIAIPQMFTEQALLLEVEEVDAP